MKKGYDLSKGERGKFFRKGAKLHLPVYLDDEMQSYLQQRAQAKNPLSLEGANTFTVSPAV